MKTTSVFIISVLMALMCITPAAKKPKIWCTKRGCEKPIKELKTELQGGALDASSILASLDSKYEEQLNIFLAPVLQNPSSRFVKCWHVKTDGWSTDTFHGNCNGKGPTVTIVQVNDYIFGGYTDVSWASPAPCDYPPSDKSFIYSLYNINGFAPVKLQIKPGADNKAIYRCPYYGPCFGGELDIAINVYDLNGTYSFTNCGDTYHLPPGYSLHDNCTFYAKSDRFTPTDVEVLYETII